MLGQYQLQLGLFRSQFDLSQDFEPFRHFCLLWGRSVTYIRAGPDVTSKRAFVTYRSHEMYSDQPWRPRCVYC